MHVQTFAPVAGHYTGETMQNAIDAARETMAFITDELGKTIVGWTIDYNATVANPLHRWTLTVRVDGPGETGDRDIDDGTHTYNADDVDDNGEPTGWAV